MDRNMCQLYPISNKRIINYHEAMQALFENGQRPLSQSPSTMTQLLLRSRTEFRDRKRGQSDQMWACGSLSDHRHVCPQALLSLGLSVCLFVKSQVPLRVKPDEVKSPISHIKKPGTINRNMKCRPVNAEDVFRGLRDWRQTALPNDTAKRRDLNLQEPSWNSAAPAALQKIHSASVRTVLTVT
ncbi:uncharacterized protein V6R79_015278 [Siganus canaliculatus]